jgi:hypothetical protein
MRRITLLSSVLVICTALPLAAQSEQPQSLGDWARQVRQERDKNTRKATKVFTNDNLPAPKPGETLSYSPAPAETPSTTEPGAAQPGAAPPESKEDKLKTRDYWQGAFKAARGDLAKAKEMERLSEDELSLLQIQQVREADPNAKADLTARVQAKQAEVDANKAATDKAQKALDDLEKAFKDSGAPDEWSQTT